MSLKLVLDLDRTLFRTSDLDEAEWGLLGQQFGIDSEAKLARRTDVAGAASLAAWATSNACSASASRWLAVDADRRQRVVLPSCDCRTPSKKEYIKEV